MPVFNFATITAFLAWFGGTGYILTRHSSLLVTVIVLIAIAGGLVGAAIIFWFIVKFLLTHDHALDPADYERVGVLGRISSAIRQGGTGEIIFSQEGTRQTCGARSEDGEPLARGTEVIVTRYERGIAYVRRWEEMADSHGVDSSQN
jgi:membrane protein implicated in regulation of membrane protease activity